MSEKHILNLIGLRCPDTMLFLKKKLRSCQIGDLIIIITDDITTKREIPLLCHFLNYILIKSNVSKIPYSYFLKKK